MEAEDVDRDPWLRLNGFSKPGDRVGIQGVRLGKQTDGAGDVPDLARIDHGDF